MVAQYIPGDQSPDYTSPYAGAYFSLTIGEESLPLSSYTYEKLEVLKSKLGDNCGLGKCWSTEYQHEPLEEDYLKKLLFANYEIVESSDPRIAHGVKYMAWVFNPPKFTQSIMKYVLDKGVSLEVKRLNHIKEINTPIIFNCSGNGAKKLGGVEDSTCYPVRGQVVVIRAPHINECVLFWSEDESTYIIKRPDSNTDECILGGFYQDNVGDMSTYGFETKDILERTSSIYPKILNGGTIDDLQILRVVAGLRPGRKDGPRIEVEKIETGHIIHNYGAEGSGYLFGLGMAHKAVKKFLEI